MQLVMGVMIQKSYLSMLDFSMLDFKWTAPSVSLKEDMHVGQ